MLALAMLLMGFTNTDRATPAMPLAFTDDIEVEPCMNEDANHTFQNGEVLVYKIYYNWNFVWLSAGELTLTVSDEGSQYHYNAKGKTYSSYEWFFTVNDEYNSWVDKNTLLPNYSERSIEEGDYRIFEKISFNQNNKKATVWRAEKRGMKEDKTEHYLADCVHDVLSTLYKMRNYDVNKLKPGNKIPYRVFMDKEEFPLKMRFAGKNENKKVHNNGRFNTLRFEPEVLTGNVFNEGTQPVVWVSDDANLIPVLIETPVSVGSVKVVLKDYKNLKYPLTSKVK